MDKTIMGMTLHQRAANYARVFPNWPPPQVDDRWLDAMWVLGNDYRGSGYYGAYPPNYLKRVMALFPDAEDILHLFAGSLTRDWKADYFDLADGDAHQLSSYYPPDSFDLILADPPYSAEDANHYGTPMINRSQVLWYYGLVVTSYG